MASQVSWSLGEIGGTGDKGSVGGGIGRYAIQANLPHFTWTRELTFLDMHVVLEKLFPIIIDPLSPHSPLWEIEIKENFLTSNGFDLSLS